MDQMYTQATWRPWVSAGVTLAAASVVAVAPTAPAGAVIPRVEIPEIQLTGLGTDTAFNVSTSLIDLAYLYEFPALVLQTPVDVVTGLISQPADAGAVLGDLGSGLQQHVESLLTGQAATILSGVGNAALGPLAGPLLELYTAVNGGDLLGAPEDMLNAFLNGGVDYPDPLSFLGDTSVGLLGNASASSWLDFGGGPGFLNGPFGIPLMLGLTGSGLLANIPIQDASGTGLLSTVATGLDGLLGTSVLGDGIDSIRDFLVTDVLGGAASFGDGIGATIADGLQAVLGDVVHDSLLDVVLGGSGGLFGLGTMLASLPTLLLELML